MFEEFLNARDDVLDFNTVNFIYLSMYICKVDENKTVFIEQYQTCDVCRTFQRMFQA